MLSLRGASASPSQASPDSQCLQPSVLGEGGQAVDGLARLRVRQLSLRSWVNDQTRKHAVFDWSQIEFTPLLNGKAADHP